jgi:diaminopimelate epimerase
MMGLLKFTKMHGLGNDYVYVNGFAEHVDDPNAVSRKVADRHRGVGGDGLILILPPTQPGLADARMRMFNADGSEGEMCGNGVRCVAKYTYDHGLSKSNPLRVETGRGVLTLALKTGGDGKVEQVTVDMDEPILDLPKIPVDREKVVAGRPHEFKLSVAQSNELLDATFVSMGNPHVVVFVPDVTKVELERVGPMLERHPAFPKRINVHFAQVISPAELRMRTWERGSGVTQACGTGACAVGVAASLTGRAGRTTLIHLPGGDLHIEWREADNRVYMTGPATEVFSGAIEV